jgi:hypothetical protein
VHKELIGLNKWLYTFGINDHNMFVDFKNKLSSTGTITEVFINNGYAFEYRQLIKAY